MGCSPSFDIDGFKFSMTVQKMKADLVESSSFGLKNVNYLSLTSPSIISLKSPLYTLDHVVGHVPTRLFEFLLPPFKLGLLTPAT